MAQIFVVVRDEGAWSDRTWQIIGVFSTLENATAMACQKTADEFLKWLHTQHEESWLPYHIEQYRVDDAACVMGHIEIEWHDVEQRHPAVKDKREEQEAK